MLLVASVLPKICQNTGFLSPAFSRIRTEPKILSLYGKIRSRKNLYSDGFCAVLSRYYTYWKNVATNYLKHFLEISVLSPLKDCKKKNTKSQYFTFCTMFLNDTFAY